MKIWLSWIVGIATYVMLGFGLDALSKAIHVPVSFESFSDDGAQLSTFGFAANALSIMVSVRVGMAVNANALRGNVDAKGEIDFLAWFFGVLVYSIWGALLYLASRGFDAQWVFYVLDALGLAGIAWGGRTWHNLRVSRL